MGGANDALPGTRKGKGNRVRKRNVQEGICERGADDLVDVRIRDTGYEVWNAWAPDGVGLRRSSGPGTLIGETI